jgi:uncharacterized repeat protein (TIGR01451 family)
MSARAAVRRLALGALGLLVSAGAVTPARAQVVRAFAPRFTSNQKGDITIVGNTLMTCSGGGTCTNGRNGTGGSVNNNNFTMVYVNADADASTFSSSGATLTLPAGTSVLFAGLYWGGDSNNASRNTCRFATPAAGYATITATSLDANATDYHAFADVTARVQAGGNGAYWTANVYSTPNSSNRHAGWSLVVVYADTSAAIRNLVVLDGYAHVSTTTNVTTTVGGFVTPPAGAVTCRLGVVAYEGDFGYTGDSFRLNGTNLTNAVNPANNFFNSSISQFGVRFTAKTPDYLNQLGFDADLVNANGILGNGATTATLTLTSTQDEYYPGVLTFATDLYAPLFDDANFTKTVTDLNGGQVRPGDVLEYVLTMRNTGQDHALQCTLRDTLASTLTYVAGSLSVLSGPNPGPKTDVTGDDQMEYVAATRTVIARLGTGANAANGGQIDVNATTSVRFRAQVTPPAPTGTVVSNQATLAFVAAQSGVPFTARSDGDAATGGTQPTVVTTTSVPITGTVFEDVNYGGGAGRSLAAASGAGSPGARVELYDASGNFRAFANADASGVFTLDGWSPGLYTVRVVNSTVASTRPGGVAGLLPVQTFRTDATSGTALPLADRVGGETPSLADAGPNTTSASLASLTTAATTAQSVSPVTLGASAVGGVDFGFNFDTIVNANDTGQGTLRQFILNANALGNAGIAQAGLPAGVETAVFMVSNGAAHPGLRAGLADLLTAGTVRITCASALPAITGALTRVDGATQAANVGDTNPGLVGTGASVGVDALATAVLPAPELELRGAAGVATGLDVQAADVGLANLALLGFGTVPGSDASALVRVGAAAHRARLERLVLGATAQSFTDPGAALRARADHVRVVGGDDGTVLDCLLGYGAGSGLALTAGSDGWTLEGCAIFSNTLGNATLAQVSLAASGGLTATRTLVQSGDGPGVDALTATGGVSLTNLTLRLNGRGSGAVTPGARLGGPGGTLTRCVVSDNYGAGVAVAAGGSGWTLSRDSFSGNGTVHTLAGGAPSGQVGIDLLSTADDPAAGTSPFVTRNDMNDADAGGNALVNFPVLEGAILSNGQFSVSGWARPGATLELYVTDGDASGFGEGRTWVATLVEGSAADLDAGVTSYAPLVNGLDQGADATSRFRFTLPLPPGVATGVALTSTATLAGVGTSEFSGRVVVGTGVSVSGTAYEDLDHDAQRDAGESGSGLLLWAKLVASGGGSATQVAAVAPASGDYAFAFVSAGTWTVLLDDTDDPNDLVPGLPAGWIGTEHPGGSRLATVNATDVAGQNFGLWHGSRVDGLVFRDDGAAGAVANSGASEAGEAGLAGRRVRWTSAACAGGACDSTLTDAAGAFTLWLPHTAAGPVAVQETNALGWLSTGGSPGTTAGSYDRASDALAFVAASGIAYTGVQLGDVPPNLWAAPGALGVPGGTAAYHRHTFTAASAGSMSVGTVTTPVPPFPGWGLTLWQDLDCDGALDPAEPPLPATLPLSAGQSVCVIARHQAPLGASAGSLESATLTASFSYANAVPALIADQALTDVTTITLANGLVIAKSVDQASAAPGSVLVYTITYTNPGTVPLGSIVIRDGTPPWTTFDSAGCVASGAGITGCSLTQQPSAGGTGTVEWTLTGSLLPGGTGTVSFRVRVD